MQIDFDQVKFLKAEINYTKVYLNTGTIKLFTKTLLRFEEELKINKDFARINRSSIINKKYIQTFDEYEVKLNSGEVFPISRRRKLALPGILT